MAKATAPEKPKHTTKSYTLPPSPTHSLSSSSSSSDDFEFTISISPRKSSTALCLADDLFYKGQLLPLAPSPRISMVKTLLSSSSSSSSVAAARYSSGSSNDSQHSFFTGTDCDSSRPSSVTDDDEFKRFHNPLLYSQTDRFRFNGEIKKTNKYLFALSKFSSLFRKEQGRTRDPDGSPGSSSSSVKVRRLSATAREVIRKYLKKVKPLYEKLSQKQQQQRTETATKTASFSLLAKTEGSENNKQTVGVMLSHSFSGNLGYPRRKKSCISSCPSSMRSSPSHSGVLSRSAFAGSGSRAAGYGRDSSTMEELQSAIQGAIAHCKRSWIQNKSMVSNEI